MKTRAKVKLRSETDIAKTYRDAGRSGDYAHSIVAQKHLLPQPFPQNPDIPYHRFDVIPMYIVPGVGEVNEGSAFGGSVDQIVPALHVGVIFDMKKQLVVEVLAPLRYRNFKFASYKKINRYVGYGEL